MANEDNINVLILLNGIANYMKQDKKPSCEDDFELIQNFADKILKNYPEIKNFEILNEPNYTYIKKEDINLYSKIVKKISQSESKQNNQEIVAGGGVGAPYDMDTSSSAETFLNTMMNDDVNKYVRSYSTHIYDWSDSVTQGLYFKRDLIKYIDIYNKNGGFIKDYVTEYGVPVNAKSDKGIVSEDDQARIILQQSIILDKYGVDLGIQYNFWDIGTDSSDIQNNFGLVRNDYTPKKSYYAIKEYNKNTNGAKYMGYYKENNNKLELNVYDKDGQCIIIANNGYSNSNTIIDYLGFIAYDFYGNKIEPDSNNKLTITNSPVYLKNISNKYFYQAISNTALEKYTNFETNYSEQLNQLPEIKEEIEAGKAFITNVGKLESIDEDTAKNAMKTYYEIGNKLIEVAKNGNINIENIKLSSMLNSLNDIGNSYENLITISATTRNAKLEETKNSINEAQDLINNNEDLEIVYPNKILKFSKDLYDKAEYINSLEEENDIKTGLIISNNLHAKLLADWSKEFSNLYIDNYISQNPTTITYSETNLTNKNIEVTLNTQNDTQVTNNSNNNKYIFKENGTFTFEITRRDRKYQITTEVKNIDKTPPKIEGVENKKIYQQTSITPTITDENLQEVKLTIDGELKEYKEKMTFTQEGTYSINATDKAGNETIMTFTIIEPEADNNYKLQDNYIKNIQSSTNLNDFTKKLNANIKYKIYKNKDDNKEEVKQDEIIATGDTLEIENGTTYNLIVKGDCNKDGLTNIVDLVRLRKQIVNEGILDDIENKAADLNGDGIVNIVDLVKMRKSIVN